MTTPMKKTLILFTLLFAIHSFSQETKLKEYSHTEFFKMIAAEKDSIFTLENAFSCVRECTKEVSKLKFWLEAKKENERNRKVSMCLIMIVR